jgi:Xaa-Pro aminopeptidase
MTTPRIAAAVLVAEERAKQVEIRLAEVRQLLERNSAAGILMDTRRDFAWLTLGGQNYILGSTETGVAPILVTGDDAVVLAPVNEFDRIADEEIAGLPLRIESTPWWQPGAALDKARQAIGKGRLLTGADVADDLRDLRSLLTSTEHARMEWLAALVLDVTADALANVAPGTREDEIVARAAGRFAAENVRLPVVLTASDDRIDRYRHPIPKPRPIENRVMLIVVAECWGLHVAHTEFGELAERGPEIDDRAAKLAEILNQMRAATIPGNTLGGVLDAAREAYDATELEREWTLHHQGGTIGYQARERVATPGDRTLIRPGMAFAWNPSAVGFKREETLYLDESGAQHVLTTTPD